MYRHIFKPTPEECVNGDICKTCKEVNDMYERIIAENKYGKQNFKSDVDILITCKKFKRKDSQ